MLMRDESDTKDAMYNTNPNFQSFNSQLKKVHIIHGYIIIVMHIELNVSVVHHSFKRCTKVNCKKKLITFLIPKSVYFNSGN